MADLDVTRIQERVKLQLEAVEEITQQMAQIRARGKSSDGLIELELGPGRVLLDVTVDSSALRQVNTSTIEKAMTEAHQDASLHLSETLAQLTARLPNAESILAMVGGELPENLRETVRAELESISEDGCES